MVVNLAAHSPHSKMNFEALNDLYSKFESFGFEILAFPSNQFGHKDTMNDSELRDLIEEQWNVKFPIFHKVKVNGKDTDEVFKYLRSRTAFFVGKRETPQIHEGYQVGLKIKDIPGDFCKFLLDSKGQVVDCLPHANDDPRKLEQRILKLLGLSTEHKHQVGK